MSNTYFIFNDKVAFHPGYYVKELIDDMGITQEDFSKRLGVSAKTISKLVNGEQNLSSDIATRLARLLGTSITYWLNLQQTYDELKAEKESYDETEKERSILQLIDFNYFKNYINTELKGRRLSAIEKIKFLREFLGISSLLNLTKQDLATSYRSYKDNLTESNIVNTNIMIQLAINSALKTDTSKYNKKKFKKEIDFALTLTSNHDDFLPQLKEAFLRAGVILVIMPNLKNSGITGFTKKLNDKVLLMVNDRMHRSDVFWFTLMHEIGHIINEDYGIVFTDNSTAKEEKANLYAQNMLIPPLSYEKFRKNTINFTEEIILQFAEEINRDPSIVLGRLIKDEVIDYTNRYLYNKFIKNYNFANIEI